MSALERKVLDEIEKRGLEPKPPMHFLARRSIYWGLAIASVALGAMCVALAIFAARDMLATGGSGLDEMPFDDVLPGLPVLWLAVFASFVASAAAAFRNTRRGYRFRPPAVAAAAAALSVALGVALHAAGAGSALHRAIAARFPAYAQMTHIPYAEWSRPDGGYLGGEALSVDGKSLLLKAFDGKIWMVDIASAANRVGDDLAAEGDLAIRGRRTGPLTFEAAEIDPFD